MVGRVDANAAALDQHLALICVVDAAEDLHQGRLAGPVVPDERHDLAPVQRRVDPAQREHAAESLDDPPCLENRLRVGHFNPLRAIANCGGEEGPDPDALTGNAGA